MTGREYDDWFTAGDEQLIAGQLEMDRRHQAAQSRIRHTYARKQIRRMFVIGVAVLCGVVIGPHAWHYVQFQAHSFSNWMAQHGREMMR
jgi:hypothetical protein